MSERMSAVSEGSIDTAVRVLRDGGIVAFPTDTVYGMGCDAYAERAIDRIYAMKRRNKDKPLVMFLAEKNSIRSYVRKPGKSAQRLCDHFFPGALTLIFRARKSAPPALISRNGSISIRIPDYQFIRKVIRQLDRPLATTSANSTGQDAPLDHRAVQLPVDLVIEDDAVIGERASAVLDASVFPFVLRRKGSVSMYAIERIISSKVRLDPGVAFDVLFVCTGNSCRSPMAEGMLRHKVRERGLRNISVSSCGLHAGAGYPATENALRAMRLRGYEIKAHRSRPAAECDMGESDLILCMERFQRDEIVKGFPGVEGRTFVLAEYCGRSGDIPDPIGGDLTLYRSVASVIERCICKVADELELRSDRSEKHARIKSRVTSKK
jgi:tRNA threonylcarbamoyl adenosine modification protein (Sua5/YciO/YrdC/YwlC family)